MPFSGPGLPPVSETSSAMQVEERRREVRHQYGNPIHLRLQRMFRAHAIDLSLSGAAVNSRRLVKPGSELEIVFLNRSISVMGVGIMFREKEEDVVEVLLRLSGVSRVDQSRPLP
jgi:hypothetical protein